MGQSKALLAFEGEPLLTRVVRNVASFCEPIVVVAQADQVLPPHAPARVVHDVIPDSGPLVGLSAGVEAIGGITHAPWVFVCTTDAPWVSRAVIECMAVLGEGFDAVVARVRGKEHVLTALYRPSLGQLAGRLVASGERRASRLSHEAHTRFVETEELLSDPAVLRDDPDLATFDNVNTPEDLERARTRRP
jgi:molybdopterin-guanine dinucleotide biosynthesis protein A